MAYFFETKELTVGYNGTPLINDISLQIKQGEIVTLIGPNGSGKSTILKTITKHLAAIKGTVYIGKDELGKLSYRDLSKRVAVVLTERIRPELMTCREVVASGRYPYTNHLGILSAEDEAIVEETMRKVNVLELSDRSYNAISDGQRQRILLARAICQEPEIIVLDEPTSFLDIRHKVELLDILNKMAKEKGVTVIMSLHEIDLAQKISDCVVCVRGDRISHFGTPEEIFKNTNIQELYQIQNNTYNLFFGSIELPKVTGNAKTFVISACGSGIGIFHRLQKEGIPFYAGILYENDIDYQVAKALAVDVISEAPFMEMKDETIDRALRLMKECDEIIVCDVPIGDCNHKIKKLLEVAEERRKV